MESSILALLQGQTNDKATATKNHAAHNKKAFPLRKQGHKAPQTKRKQPTDAALADAATLAAQSQCEQFLLRGGSPQQAFSERHLCAVIENLAKVKPSLDSPEY